jgi:dTDP-4-dehydrorhamnose reductase
MSVLFIGGSGLLGRHVRELEPQWDYPTHQEFDILDWSGMKLALSMLDHPVTNIIHAAAFISPPKVEADPMQAMQVNIVGTVNMVRLAQRCDARLIYISTDYVFNGERGNYLEEHPVHPVNKYAWSKLGGECAVRMYGSGLIIRGSFGPAPFPYPKAYTDHYTTKLPVAEFAKRLVRVVKNAPGLHGVLHIGGESRSLYEYAREVSPDLPIEPVSRATANPEPPRNTSLNTNKFDILVKA